MAWPIDSTFIAEVLPPRARANVYSLRSGAWNLGYALTSLIGGVIIVADGYRPTFVIFCIFSILSTATFVGYFWWHYRDLNRRAGATARGAVSTAP